MSEEIEKSLSRFFQNQLLPRQQQISDTDPLISSGVLDSIQYLRLISFLEKEYKISVAIDEFDPKNFESIKTIANFVRKKLSKE